MTESSWRGTRGDGRHALEIRRLRLPDVHRVCEIERHSFPTMPWSFSMFVLELSKRGSINLAATLPRGRIAGFLICSRLAHVWHIMNIAVEPTYRRRGIATAMISHLLREADRDGAQYTLEVRQSNRAALAMYAAYGFVAVGRRFRYYRDTGEDAIIMWRTIGVGPVEVAPGVVVPGAGIHA